MTPQKKDINIAFLPFERLDNMSFEERVKYIISIVKQNKILVIDGGLNPEEEGELISETMRNIGDEFTGIELGSINLDESEKKGFVEGLRRAAFHILTGRRRGLTIIGPARIVKDIKRNPDNLNILMK